MKALILTRTHLFLGTVVWMGLFFALSITQFNHFEVLNIVGFLFLSLVPGLLTVFALEIKNLPFWGYLVVIIGFSILELMVSVLLGNTLLPFVGVARPLDRPFLLFDIYLLVSILMGIVWLRVKDIEIQCKPYVLFDTARDAVIALTPILFVILSVLGAIHLNDGGSGIITLIMLGSMALYIPLLVRQSDSADKNVIPTALFFMTVSLLFMTSLRGWYVTGHDIQRETQVFQLAKTSGLWSMAAYRDAYNACLSITILPTLFTNLLRVLDQYVFKIFFQIFFALCAVLVYLIGLRWTSARNALLGALYFIAFPTFFSDMPFIVRQEIAFLFFGLMLYIIFEPGISLRLRRALFVIMGIGVILSHYSTTYTILFVFGLVVVSKPLFATIFSFLQRKSYFLKTGLFVSGERAFKKSRITFLMITFLVLASFLWTSTITQTSNSITSVITQTISAIQAGSAGNNKSIDALSLLSFAKIDHTHELQNFITDIVGPLRDAAPPGTYYPQASYSQYPIRVLDNEKLPATVLGQFINWFGINSSATSSFLEQLLAKLLEILAPIGMLYILYRNSSLKKIDSELYLVASFCLIFIFLNLVLPVLSAQYGVFRALQQSLFVLGFIIVIGSTALGKWITSLLRLVNRRLTFAKFSGRFSLGLLVLFFLYSTSFIPQILGGNVPALHLNNLGIYYDNYVTKGTEVYGVNWLVSSLIAEGGDTSHIQFEISTDLLTRGKFESLTDLRPFNDIFPDLIRKNSFIFLGYGTVKDHEAAFSFNGDLVPYSYPIQFLDVNKDLIYNNGGTRIYR
ncbi:DUF2206 domain-containing protein [Patescibacteria group bacterium]|nr:DUF2206 domain-containing protein [Patescibacteria group bacterium]